MRANKAVSMAMLCMKDARYVHYTKQNSKSVADFVEKNWENDFSIPEEEDKLKACLKDENEWVEFLGIMSALNFAFTNFHTPPGDPDIKYEVEYPRDRFWRGAYAMRAALVRALIEGFNILDFSYLAAITKDDVVYILRGKTIVPMFEQRVKQMRNYGTFMRAMGFRSVKQMLEKCDFHPFSYQAGSNSGHGEVLPGFIDYLTSSSVFADRAVHPSGFVIDFNKRANLFALEYQTQASRPESKLVPLADQHLLLPPADYQVPRALQAMGFISYAPELEEQIIQRKLIARNSRAEIEIRAATVVVVDMLLRLVNKRRAQRGLCYVGLPEFDRFLWLSGRRVEASALPHHLTITTAY